MTDIEEKKLKYKEWSENFERNGCKMVTPFESFIPRQASTVTYLCKCGNKCSTRYSSFLTKVKKDAIKCKKCRLATDLVEMYTEWKTQMKKRGYTLLTSLDDFIGKKTVAMDWMCGCGNRVSTSYSKLISRKGDIIRCVQCRKRDNSVTDLLRESDCEILGTEKLGEKLHYMYRCPCGKEMSRSANQIKMRGLCSSCNSGWADKWDETRNEIQEYCKLFGITLITPIEEIKDVSGLIWYKCGQCSEITQVSVSTFKQQCKDCKYSGTIKKCIMCPKKDLEGDIESKFDELGVAIKSIDKKDGHMHITYTCHCGRDSSTYWSNVKGKDSVECMECNARRDKYKCKDYTFEDGKTVTVQGYEPKTLSLLEELGYTSNDMITSRKDMPKFSYRRMKMTLSDFGEDGDSKYYPDIYIPKKKLVIEVKSDWTFTQNTHIIACKCKSVLREGLRCQIHVWDGKNLLRVVEVKKDGTIEYTGSQAMKYISRDLVKRAVERDMDDPPTGVIFDDDRNRWRVVWSVNGKKRQRTFSCAKHGDEQAFNMACDVRDKEA